MFLLRQLTRHSPRVVPACRAMSASAGPLVDVVDSDGIAVVTLNRPPVNSLNLELLQAFNKTLDEVATNKPRGLILTSASPTVFCAGLDITELYNIDDMERLVLFRRALQDAWIKLFGYKFATAAAVNGHSPAGGCLLAMSCEYRAMVSGDGKYTIGLNESALGIVASPWFMDTMCHTIHTRDAELALTAAKMFTAEEALKVGLIDDIAANKDEAMKLCGKFIQRFDKIPPHARTISKLGMRQETLMKLQNNRQQDIDEYIQAVKDPQVRKELGAYLQRLKQKSAKK